MTNENQTKKFFIYARKSTDSEDRQIRSIADQLAELRELAKKENIDVVDTLVEKQTAKKPGRPVFAEMLKRIEAGEATGILAWHPFMSNLGSTHPLFVSQLASGFEKPGCTSAASNI